MLRMAHAMGNHLIGMPMDIAMLVGVALIILGVPVAAYSALPKNKIRLALIRIWCLRLRTLLRSVAGTS